MGKVKIERIRDRKGDIFEKVAAFVELIFIWNKSLVSFSIHVSDLIKILVKISKVNLREDSLVNEGISLIPWGSFLTKMALLES